MLFSKQLSFPDLIGWCRALRHQLGAGVSLRKTLGQQAERGSAAVRPMAQRVAAAVDYGDALADAFEREKNLLPPLFISLARVGEQTGHFPEIMGELEKYYTLQYSLQRQFRNQSIMPIIQLVLAFLILGALITILGWIAASRPGTTPISLFGLRGFGGTLIFWSFSFGLLALAFFAYRKLPGLVQGQAAFDAKLLKVPGLGPCLEALALGRFALCLHLTMETGMSIGKAVKLSLNATGNTALAAAGDDIAKSLKKGQPLAEAMGRCPLFPVDFVQIVAVAEEGGRVPEVMRQQADRYHEEAALRMKTLVRMATMAVWFVYACFMVYAIFRVASVYLGQLGV
jgi:type II secretory pathway component PulF